MSNIAYVNGGSSSGAGLLASFLVTWAQTAGDTLVVFVSMHGISVTPSTVVTDTAGNAYTVYTPAAAQDLGFGNGMCVAVAIGVASMAANANTISFSYGGVTGNVSGIDVLEYSGAVGVDFGAPLGTVISGASPVASYTVASAGAMALQFGFNANGYTAATSPWTDRASSTDLVDGVDIAEQFVPTFGTTVNTVFNGASGDNGIIVLALRPPSVFVANAYSTDATGVSSSTVTANCTNAQIVGHANVLTIFAGASSVSTVTDSSGNIYAAVNTQTDLNGHITSVWVALNILAAAAAANTITVTFAVAVTNSALVVSEVASTLGPNTLALSTGFSGGAGAVGTTGTTGSTSFTLTEFNNALLLYGWAPENGGETVGSGSTLIQDCPTYKALAGYRLVTGKGTYSLTATGTSGPWGIAAAALRQAIFAPIQAIGAGPATGSMVTAFANAQQIPGGINVVIVEQALGSTITGVTDTRGNTYKLATGFPFTGLDIYLVYYAFNIAAGANTVTVGSAAPSGANASQFEIACSLGAVTLDPFDGSGGASTAAGPSTASASVTPAAATLGDIVLGYSGNNPVSAGTGYINIPYTPQNSTLAEYNAFGTVGSQSVPFNVFTFQQNDVVAFALRFVIQPTITSQPSSAACLIGTGTATFTVSATASGGSLSYQWQVNGSNVTGGTGGTTASYTTATGQLISDDRDAYTCIVTDLNGSTTTSVALLRTFWNVTGSQSDGAIGALAIGELPAQQSGAITGIATASFQAVNVGGALAGTASASFAATGTLKGAGALAGNATCAFAATGALVGSGALSGIATCAFASTGSIGGAGALAGSATCTFAAASTPAIAGTATCTFAGIAAPTVSGTGSCAFAATGSLLGAGALAGTASCTFAATSTPTVSGSATCTFAAKATATVSGNATCAFAATGALSELMVGTASCTFAATSTPTIASAATCAFNAIASFQNPIAGVASCTFAAIGSLKGAGALLGTSTCAFSASATAALSGRGSATFAGVGTLQELMGGASGCTFAATGTLTGPANKALCAFTASATLQELIFGVASCSFTAAGQIQGIAQLEGIAACAFGASATGTIGGEAACAFGAQGTMTTGTSIATCAFGAQGTLTALFIPPPDFLTAAYIADQHESTRSGYQSLQPSSSPNVPSDTSPTTGGGPALPSGTPRSRN